MSVRILDQLFAPRRIAVVGAGSDRSSVGHIVLRNLLEGGFEGVVFPVNPSRESVHGIQAYASVGDTLKGHGFQVEHRPDQGVVVGKRAAAPARPH